MTKRIKCYSKLYIDAKKVRLNLEENKKFLYGTFITTDSEGLPTFNDELSKLTELENLFKAKRDIAIDKLSEKRHYFKIFLRRKPKHVNLVLVLSSYLYSTYHTYLDGINADIVSAIYEKDIDENLVSKLRKIRRLRSRRKTGTVSKIKK